MLAHGPCQGQQRIRIDRGRLVFDRHGCFLHRRDVCSDGGRHDLIQFRHRAQRRLPHARDGAARGKTQAHRDRDRFLLVQQQRRERTTRTQLVTTASTAAGLHRVTEFTQPVDVASDRAGGHPEPLREILAGPDRLSLEQPEQLQQSCGGRRHTDKSPSPEDRSCPLPQGWRASTLL